MPNECLTHKKNDPSEISNYRHISLLSTVGKVLEKIVHKHIFNFFHEHHVITTLQSGFVPGDSTINQLVDIYNTFCKALDEGKEVRAIVDEPVHAAHTLNLDLVKISRWAKQWLVTFNPDKSEAILFQGNIINRTTPLY